MLCMSWIHPIHWISVSRSLVLARKERRTMSTNDSKKTQRKVKLGSTGPEVFPLGLGCMGFSGMYGATDDAESIRTIQTAIDRGITLIDTGDFYGMGHNEMLVGRAI